MIPLIKRLINSLLFDELAVTRWLRGLCLALAAGGVALGDQLADLIGAPEVGTWIKGAAIVAGFVGGAITAGERNPPAVQS